MSRHAAPAAVGHHHRGAAFWVSAAAGWVVIGWAAWQIFHHRVDTRPGQLGRFFLGGIVLHDLLLVPVTLLLGGLTARAAPSAARRWVQAALVMAGVAVLFAYPLVRGFAHVLRNPTSLPRNYTVALLVVVAAVWGGFGVAAATRAVLRRHGRRGRRPPATTGSTG